MDILINSGICILSLFALIKGADTLVDGGSSLAKKMGISSLVIGLTIVAFGTSAPEFFVNVVASLDGRSGITMGNILGSNIANTLLGIGITAIIVPLVIGRSTVWKEVPFMFLATLLIVIFASDQLIDNNVESFISRSESFALLSFFLIFMVYTYGISKAGGENEVDEVEEYSYIKSFALFFGGLALLAIGGNYLVSSSSAIAFSLGVSERLIGLTIVALGTSLPDIIVTVISAMKGRSGMAVGNIVGSNIFNALWILGISGIITPVETPIGAGVDLIFLLGITFLFIVFMHTNLFSKKPSLYNGKHIIGKVEGGVFVVLYFMYILFLILS